MTIDEMIAVLQAAKEGKVIQTRGNANRGKYDWEETNKPLWNFYLFDYRVKQKVLRYRKACMKKSKQMARSAWRAAWRSNTKSYRKFRKTFNFFFNWYWSAKP